MHLRLGIDLDGVVADFNEGWTRLYNADYGTELHPDEVTMWNAPSELTHFGSMSKFWRWAATCGEGASLFRVLNPYPESIEVLADLSRHHTIVIVTTKPAYAVWDTFEWLAEHRVPTTEVHIVQDKTVVDCDVYLDDGDHNLEELVAARPESTVCRFVRPWNRPHDGVVDVHGWRQFRELVVNSASYSASRRSDG